MSGICPLLMNFVDDFQQHYFQKQKNSTLPCWKATMIIDLLESSRMSDIFGAPVGGCRLKVDNKAGC